MYSKTQLAKKFLRHYLSASNGKGHGIHSPFVFDFIIHVLNDRQRYPAYEPVEGLRRALLKDKRILNFRDYGAGAVGVVSDQRRLAQIVRHSAKSSKWGALLYRIAHYYRPRTLVELGTSAGISSAYLAMGNPEGTLITIEGAPAIAAIAAENFQKLGLKNIHSRTGPFDEMLPPVLDSLREQDKQLELAFIDGNHRKEPTLKYFDLLARAVAAGSVIILDDIHWSPEMEEAWEDIKQDPRVMLTVDLFFIGLVFFRKEFKVKQHFKIRF